MNTNRYQFSRILHPKVNSPELGEQSLNKLDYMKCILNMERVFDTEKNGLSIVDFFYGIDVAKKGICFQYKMAEYLGYTKEDLAAVKSFNLLHPEEMRQVIRLVARIKDFIRGGGKAGMECFFVLCHRLKKRNGEHIRVLRYIRPWSVDEQYNVQVYHCLCLDVTRQSQPEGVTFDVRLPAHFHQTKEEVLSFFADILSQENPKFSDRELEVLRIWSSTDSTKLATGTLGISERTIETHLKNMRKKLGVRRTMDVVLFAKERGWF